MESLVIISGPVNSGKTTLLAAVGAYLSGDIPQIPGLPPGWLPTPPVEAGGILAEADWDGERKIGYRAREIGTLREWPLIAENPGGPDWRQGPGRFWNNPPGFRGIRKVLFSQKHKPVLLLDEAGPLELAGAGHGPLLDGLSRSYRGILLVTARQGLEPEIRRRWGGGRCLILKVVPGHPGTVHS